MSQYFNMQPCCNLLVNYSRFFFVRIFHFINALKRFDCCDIYDRKLATIESALQFSFFLCRKRRQTYILDINEQYIHKTSHILFHPIVSRINSSFNQQNINIDLNVYLKKIFFVSFTNILI